jgi:hypothetical protein
MPDSLGALELRLVDRVNSLRDKSADSIEAVAAEVVSLKLQVANLMTTESKLDSMESRLKSLENKARDAELERARFMGRTEHEDELKSFWNGIWAKVLVGVLSTLVIGFGAFMLKLYVTVQP